jgi:hypothetical protein
MINEKPLHSLIPIETFKALLSIVDRDDNISRFCLVASTYTTEQYCKRQLLRKKHFENIRFYSDLILPLKEYPVSKILAVYLLGNGEKLEPDYYHTLPHCGTDENLPFGLSLSPALNRYRCLKALKAVYWAGYASNKIPADLTAACMELAAWNLNRYRGRRIGMTGNIRGSGKEGEHFEMSMPENVRSLLEPYKRKVI